MDESARPPLDKCHSALQRRDRQEPPPVSFFSLSHAHSRTSSGDRWRLTAATVPPAPQGKPWASPLATPTFCLPCSPPPPSPDLLWGGCLPFFPLLSTSFGGFLLGLFVAATPRMFLKQRERTRERKRELKHGAGRSSGGWGKE